MGSVTNYNNKNVKSDLKCLIKINANRQQDKSMRASVIAEGSIERKAQKKGQERQGKGRSSWRQG